MKAPILIFSLAIAALLAGCKSTTPAAAPTASPTAVESSQSQAVPYTIAHGYFIHNDIDSLPVNRITTREQFDSIFGMAAVMGKNGTPTPIDFNRQFVIAVDVPTTNRTTSIIPVSLEYVPASHATADARAKVVLGTNIKYTYKVLFGAAQSYSTHPVLIIAVDRRYDAPIVLHRLLSFVATH